MDTRARRLPVRYAPVPGAKPGTGAVKAYYGGDNGAGGDYAGFYTDPVLSNGEESCCGGHPPGTTAERLRPSLPAVNGPAPSAAGSAGQRRARRCKASR